MVNSWKYMSFRKGASIKPHFDWFTYTWRPNDSPRKIEFWQSPSKAKLNKNQMDWKLIIPIHIFNTLFEILMDLYRWSNHEHLYSDCTEKESQLCLFYLSLRFLERKDVWAVCIRWNDRCHVHRTKQPNGRERKSNIRFSDGMRTTSKYTETIPNAC